MKLVYCWTILASAAVASSLCCGNVGAQEPERRWTFGLGVAIESNPYLGATDDTTVKALPYVAYEGDRFSVSPEGLEVGLYEDDRIRLEGLVAPRWQFSDPADVPDLSDMQREISVDAGFRLSTETGPVSISLDYLTDISGRHKGQEVALTAGVVSQITPRWTVAAETGARWRDGDLGTYMYGVFDDEARPGRPVHSVSGTVSPFFGATARYALTDRVALVGGIEFEMIPEEGRDSPIIDADSHYGAFLAVTMRY